MQRGLLSLSYVRMYVFMRWLLDRMCIYVGLVLLSTDNFRPRQLAAKRESRDLKEYGNGKYCTSLYSTLAPSADQQQWSTQRVVSINSTALVYCISLFTVLIGLVVSVQLYEKHYILDLAIFSKFLNIAAPAVDATVA